MIKNKLLITIIALTVLISVVSATTYIPHYPVENTDTYVKATSQESPAYKVFAPYLATNISIPVTGSHFENGWLSALYSITNQRFSIDLGSAYNIDHVYVENAHADGMYTNRGVRNFTMYCSNTSSDFEDTSYASTGSWVQIYPDVVSIPQHINSDTADPQYFNVTGQSCRYYSFKFQNNWGDPEYIGLRRIVLQTTNNTLPLVSISVAPTIGVDPLAVELNDTTTSLTSILYYNTSWGDNSAWTNETIFPATNISHSYSTMGNYTITHYVTNEQGTETASTNISVWDAVHSTFSLFNDAGTAPFTTYLYDTSTNLTPGPVTYLTDFGEGNTSTSANVYFTWNKTGTYNVTHTVSNGLSSSTSFTNVTVGIPTPPVVAPVASFYGGPQTGNVPLTVFFTDVSSNTPTSWNWSFGDGALSTLQNPQHQYTSSGFKTVSLNVTNSAGSNITVRSKFVRVS